MVRKTISINGIAVRGFKSICDEQRVEIQPLTILAGANSSGKSSIMQPLLLLKQTLEAPGDPGALLLDGPNVRFTSADQLLSKGVAKPYGEGFAVRLERTNGDSLETSFCVEPGQGFDVDRMVHVSEQEMIDIRPNMNHEAITALLPDLFKEMTKEAASKGQKSLRWRVFRDRCFLAFGVTDLDAGERPLRFWPTSGISPSTEFVPIIQSVIHLPGLRGNPRRTYPKTAAGPHFPGTFESYTASLIFQWQADKDERLAELGRSLEELGLSWKVTAKAVDATQVELRVGRLPHSKRGGAHDLVSIADVGFGVSQSLPVLVALIAAQPGQLVYLEQPEIHLHPRAQRHLAHMLCRAAKRGVILVVETHSALLLREVQTLVAIGQMPREEVKLHWLRRSAEGATVVSTADLDENGAYGDWPEDFDETELETEQAYLDAVEQRGAGE